MLGNCAVIKSNIKDLTIVVCGTNINMKMINYDDVFKRLAASKFRSRFKLSAADVEYVRNRGMDTIARHARELITARIAPSFISNDGHQTPMRGHPVFVAQHATATCCRGCIAKWHGFIRGTQFTDRHIDYIVGLIMAWISHQMENYNRESQNGI